MIGQTISHYKIVEKLGEGGMGIVFKAQDTKLDRTVALKFLPSHLNTSEQDRMRFVQEAKAAAVLNHPNVCSVIDIQEHQGQMFIVMEFVDGQTLRDKLGTLSFKQAIDIGIQIADGLAAAHEKGIVHRDIKPENVMVRKDGIVQIMDFGLAKLRTGGSKITRLTKAGSTVGTAGYMSPEQVQGQETDHRSDIFSYGVLLYELLTGQLPFKGVHETALAYEIVNVDPPPMSSLKPEIDPNLDAIVLECLEKDPRERTQSIAQISVDLKRFRRESSRQRMSRVTAARPVMSAERPSEPGVISKRTWKASTGYILSAALAIAVVVLAWSPWKKNISSGQHTMRFSVELAENAPLSGAGGVTALTLSPDGRYLAYTAQVSNGSQIYVRRMDQLTSQPIPGTENAREATFSPDGEWLVFNSADLKLVKVSVSGGAPVVLCAVQGQTRGLFWASDNTILFGVVSDGIFRVSADGGTPVPVTTLDSAQGEISHRFPQLLPDGKTLIFTVKQDNITTFDDALIEAERIGTGERKILVRGGTYAKYLPTGHLMFVRSNTIFAIPFDAQRLEVNGSPVAIEEGGWMFGGSGQAYVDFSKDGTLAFAPAGFRNVNGFTLAWMDKVGKLHPLLDTLRAFQVQALSPDGQKIATGINAANNDIWIYHIARGTLSRLTFGGGNNDSPVWSRDGKYVYYMAEKGKTPNIFRKPWDGSGVEERMTSSTKSQRPVSCSPDGKLLSFDQDGDIWILPLEGDRKPGPFVQSPANEGEGTFSPDGRWMAYRSDEDGKNEVFVAGLPDSPGQDPIVPVGKWQVSNGGGTSPIWSPDGKELFYINGSILMVVDVLPAATFDFSVPRKVCDIPPLVRIQDVSRDGKQFLVAVSRNERTTLPRLEIVTDWFEEVKAKIGGKSN